jgi:diacylglycerol O-acyltransferase / wax synthase
MAVQLPAGGAAGERMEAIRAITRAQRHGPRAASAALLAPAFRALGAIGALRWLTEHQRMVNTFVTNLRGPEATVRFLDRPVQKLIPVNSTSGNVRVAFGAFSYAGTLSVTIVADAGLTDDLPDLADDLRIELRAVAEALA